MLARSSSEQQGRLTRITIRSLSPADADSIRCNLVGLFEQEAFGFCSGGLRRELKSFKIKIATKENRGVKSRVKSLAGFGQSVTVHKINSPSPRVPSRSRIAPPLPQPPLRVEPCAPPHSLTPYDRLRTPRRTRAARGGSRTSHAAQRRIHSTLKRPQRRAMRTPHLSNAPARRPGHNRLFGASTRTSLADQRRRRGTRRGGGGDFEFR